MYGPWLISEQVHTGVSTYKITTRQHLDGNLCRRLGSHVPRFDDDAKGSMPKLRNLNYVNYNLMFCPVRRQCLLLLTKGLRVVSDLYVMCWAVQQCSRALGLLH